MHLTQYLIFEICTLCNLSALHPKCPNRHPERYGKLPVDKPVSDEQIVEIAEAMYKRHGFRGRIGWHYYNEPLMVPGRMWRLMDAIDARVAEASYTLWTNGTLIPYDCTQFDRFDEIHVTDYGLPDYPIRNVTALVAAQPKTKIERIRLDDRLHAIGTEKSHGACHRMFTEFIVDYWGNVHLCCYDWQGRASIGNIHGDSLARLVACWHQVRNQVSGERMTDDAPGACLRCKMRSTHIPHFVPEVALDAERFARETYDGS